MHPFEQRCATRVGHALRRYSHKLMELVRVVLARLGELPVKPDRFLVRCPCMLKSLCNRRPWSLPLQGIPGYPYIHDKLAL